MYVYTQHNCRGASKSEKGRTNLLITELKEDGATLSRLAPEARLE